MAKKINTEENEMKSTRIMHDIEPVNSVVPDVFSLASNLAFKYVKTRNVKSPSRGTKGSVGFDFYVPEDLTLKTMYEKNSANNITYIMKRDGDVPAGHNEIEEVKAYQSCFDSCRLVGMRVEKHSRILIPSGIHVKLPDNHAMLAINKSGVASKEGYIRGSELIDLDYEGEVHISLINTNPHPVIVELGRKIIQFIVIPINMGDNLEVKSLDELYAGTVSQRGAGGFGSTGLK